jgi:flagellar FliL protein
MAFIVPDFRKVLITILVLLPMTLCLNSGVSGSEGEKKGEGAPSPQLSETFVLNVLSGTNNRFLKCSIYFDFSSPTIAEKVKGRLAVLRDAVIMLVSAKSADSVSSPEGKLQLKDELIIRVNQLFGDKAVGNVYFTDFIMQ